MKDIESIIKLLNKNKESIFSNIRDGNYKDQVPEYDGLLIWQYLRFNPKYIESYNSIKNNSESLERDLPPHDFSDLYFRLGTRWALDYAIDFELLVGAEEIRFKPFSIKIFETFKMSEVQAFVDLRKEDGLVPLSLLINPLFDKRFLIKEITKAIDDARNSYFTSELKQDKVSYIDPIAVKKLIINFAIYYFYNKEGITKARDITKKMDDLGLLDKNKKSYKSDEIKSSISAFEKYSLSSPWCFFNKPQTVR